VEAEAFEHARNVTILYHLRVRYPITCKIDVQTSGAAFCTAYAWPSLVIHVERFIGLS